MIFSNLPNQVLAEPGAETLKTLNYVASALALHCSMPVEHTASFALELHRCFFCLLLTLLPANKENRGMMQAVSRRKYKNKENTNKNVWDIVLVNKKQWK